MAIAEGRSKPVQGRQVPVPPAAEAVAPKGLAYIWAAARIALGWTFLWAFLDKLIGLGFATPAERSWLNGGSPTTGFLKGTAENALGGFFGALAGQAWVDWLFMIGLLGIGTALILGAGMRIAAVTGGLLMLLMWAAELPLANNPFVDDHIVYAIVLAGLAVANAGDTLGIGRWWGATELVQRFPFLR